MKGNMIRNAIISTCLAAGILLSMAGCGSSTGISSAEINEAGELILNYDNGDYQNLGVVVGRDGADGKDGTDGIDGVNGADGEDGKDGADGSSVGGVTVIGSVENISAATVKGLQSSVRIICNFTRKSGYGMGYYPSMGGSSAYTQEGSGVIYKLDKSTGDALILTNYHVVYSAYANTENKISDSISLYLYGSETEGMEIPAEYVGGSMYYDIAVLSVKGSELMKSDFPQEVEMADSDSVSVGQQAIAIGNPEGMGISATYGVVSVDSEYITMTAADETTAVSFRVIRIDTAVNSGNSGGGLFDTAGRLIGIVNAKVSDSSVENIGYAIPVPVVRGVAENIIDNCFEKEGESVQRAMLGITVKTADSHALLDTETGEIRIEESVSVYAVTSGSLADGALKEGDILKSVTDGERSVTVTRQYHIIDFMLGVRVGDTVSLTVLRDGQEITVDLVITEGCTVSY